MLREWAATLPVVRQQYARDLLPLQQQCLDLQWRFAQALDLAYDLAPKGLTKGEKQKVAVLITEIASAVLEYQEHDGLKALFNKHSGWDFDEEEAERLNGMKAMLEDVLGVELGDDVDMSSPEEVLQRMEAQFTAKLDAEAKALPPRKKSRRDELREAKELAEEKQMSQSIRDVYRKLASALHPDREPDQAERVRKTDLMQRVNQAYGKGDLLQLLALQLELEHIDPNHLADLSADRIKHYSKVLKGQLEDLNQEVRDIESEIIVDFNLQPGSALRPKHLVAMLRRDVHVCNDQISALQVQLEIAGDTRQLKAWLKNNSIRRQAYDDFGDMSF